MLAIFFAEPSSLSKQRGRNHLFCLLETEGSAKPVKPNKQQTTHALGRELFATYSCFTSNLPIFSLRTRAKAQYVDMSIRYSNQMQSFCCAKLLLLIICQPIFREILQHWL